LGIKSLDFDNNTLEKSVSILSLTAEGNVFSAGSSPGESIIDAVLI